MRHGVVSRKFDRTTSHRQLMFRNLVTEILDHEQIKTTEPKAKAIQGITEKVITMAKGGGLHARRQVMSYLTDMKVVDKLVAEIGPRYKDRNGGYTRIVKIGMRMGDGASIVQIELVK